MKLFFKMFYVKNKTQSKHKCVFVNQILGSLSVFCAVVCWAEEWCRAQIQHGASENTASTEELQRESIPGHFSLFVCDSGGKRVS